MFNVYETAIIRLLNKNDGLTINKIATKLNISWSTANKYIIKFYNVGVLTREIKYKKIYWRIDYDEIFDKK